MTAHGAVAVARPAAAGLAAAVATRLVRRGLAAAMPGAHGPRWTRTNHRGGQVSLLEGPAVAVGLLTGVAVGAPPRLAAAGAMAAAGGAAFGLVDDLTEDLDRRQKGLRGHLGALARRELTTGGLKVLGIGATSLLSAAVALPFRAGSTPASSRAGRAVWAGDVIVTGALVAASANLVNLLDLRPGRALKAAALAAVPVLPEATAGPVAAACLGTAAAALGPDLAELDMLGDGGANALGAVVGLAAAVAAPRPVRAALLAGAVALTLASERVSFTAVIARTPVLRELDAWGRRPVESPVVEDTVGAGAVVDGTVGGDTVG
jgi:hypothetical protein